MDLADPERRVVVEADGWGTHGDRRAFAADLQRHDELAALGWVTLRFAWEHVMFRPAWVVDQAREVLRTTPDRGRRAYRPATGAGVRAGLGRLRTVVCRWSVRRVDVPWFNPRQGP